MADDNGANDATEAEGVTKIASPLARRATRSLRQAKRTYEGADWQSSEEAHFLLEQANVLALMDLAEAIRETQTEKADA
jgi:hypothetical protein